MKKLEIRFLGVGNGLVNDKGTYHSCLIVTYGNDRLFIDCGSDFPYALENAGLSYRDIEHLYITHIHSDHAGALEWLGFISTFIPGKQKITLYGVKDVLYTLEETLIPSMSPSIHLMTVKGLEACFIVKTPARNFSVEEINCHIIKTLHVSAYERLYSYGLFITAGDKSVLFTSDTQFKPRLFMKYYEKADMIFHDCMTTPTLPEKPAHPHITQLARLPDHIKEKMYLYHCGPSPRPDPLQYGLGGYVTQNVPIIL
jgi:ribonuclease BN (tRNA processing enzyme)